jgi:predicted RNA-binding Zn ribbon-like protein
MLEKFSFPVALALASLVVLVSLRSVTFRLLRRRAGKTRTETDDVIMWAFSTTYTETLCKREGVKVKGRA